MTKVDERMMRLRRQMNAARMRLAAERMDRRLREYQRSAATRAEDECGPGEPQPIGEITQRLMSALADIARGDVEVMSVEEFGKEFRRRTLDS